MNSLRNIQYYNVKYPSHYIPDGYSIFKCNTLVWLLTNGYLNANQMDIQYSNIKCPFDSLIDGYSIFESQTSISLSWMKTQYLNIRHPPGYGYSQMDTRYFNIKSPSDISQIEI